MRYILISLLIALAIVLVYSYRTNKEGFENVTAVVTDTTVATDTTIATDVSGTPAITTNDSQIPADDTTSSENDTNKEQQQSTTLEEDTANNSKANTSEPIISDNSAIAMQLQKQSQILHDIQKLVKNNIIANRQTEPSNTATTATNTSAASQQGQEFDKSKPCPAYPDGSCPSMPDMTKYIKKDAIPCWGCTLDY
jgi:hypothetical protein